MEKTKAEAFFEDERVKKAKSLILEALKEHQANLEGVSPPNYSLKETYENHLEAMAQSKGAKLWFPYLGSGFGRGPLVELADGSIKYDCIVGVGPHIFGHSHPKLVEAGIDGALSNTIMQGNLQQNVESVTLFKKLCELSNLDHCFLSTSGAMACENALKLAFHHRPGTSRIIAFEHCFMGRTLSLSQITDKPDGRVGLPLNLGVDYIPFFDENDPEGSTERTLTALKRHIKRYPKAHAAIAMELIQGEGGFKPGTHTFFKKILECIKEHEIIPIFDEIQSFLRTSRPFAFQHFGLENEAQIVTLGKASQVCATLYRSKYNPKPGLLSQTFTSSTASILACLTIIDHMEKEGYFGAEGKNEKWFSAFKAKFSELESRYPGHIEGPYGTGLMFAFTPFKGEADKVTKFCRILYEEGVIAFLAGSHPMRIRFLIPAVNFLEKDLEGIIDCVERSIQRCLKEFSE